MKIYPIPAASAFTPRSVSVTIETQEELDALIDANSYLCRSTVARDVTEGSADILVNLLEHIASALT